MKKLLSACLFFISQFAVSEYSLLMAEEEAYVSAQNAYAVALEQAKVARSQLPVGRLIRYIETREEKQKKQTDTIKSLYLDESRTEVKWASSTDREETQSLDWQHSVLVDPWRFPITAKVTAETEHTWVFSIPLKMGVEVEGDAQVVDQSRVSSQLQRNLEAQLTVSKIEPRLLSQKIFSRTPFKPEAMVKVNKFQVRMTYAPAWQGGPLITQSVSRQLEGKYALFISVEEFSNLTYGDFELTEKTVDGK